MDSKTWFNPVLHFRKYNLVTVSETFLLCMSFTTASLFRPHKNTSWFSNEIVSRVFHSHRNSKTRLSRKFLSLSDYVLNEHRNLVYSSMRWSSLKDWNCVLHIVTNVKTIPRQVEPYFWLVYVSAQLPSNIPPINQDFFESQCASFVACRWRFPKNLVCFVFHSLSISKTWFNPVAHTSDRILKLNWSVLVSCMFCAVLELFDTGTNFKTRSSPVVVD